MQGSNEDSAASHHTSIVAAGFRCLEVQGAVYNRDELALDVGYALRLRVALALGI